MLVNNSFTMNFKKFFILVFVLSLGCSYSFAQKKDSSAKAKKEKKAKEPKEKKVKAPKEKKEKTPKTSSSNSGEEGGDKNFGPVFDGASVSVSTGVNVYYGDIAAYNLFPRPRQFKDHMTSAFKFSLAREIKWGLGARLSYQKGSLIGTRKTGKHSSLVTFENHFNDISLQARYFLNDALFKKNEYNRFKLYGFLGFGYMWYRSQLYDTETFNTKDYEGYIEIETTQNLSQKTLSDKTGKAKTWTVPYGLTLVFKYNYKMDLHLDFTQTTTFTDRLDAFDRDWTAKDKYNYIGIGVTYNFNRTKDDAPKKRPKKEDEKDDSTDNSSDSESTKNETIRKGIFSKKNKRKNSSDDELLNVRLKLFETQLKLFEMQYLLGK